MCNCPAHHALVDCVCACDHTNDRLDQWKNRAEELAARISAYLEPHAIVQRNIGWTGADGVLHVTEVSVCDHCVPQFKHFNSREDVPEGPCEIRRALGGDQDGGKA